MPGNAGKSLPNRKFVFLILSNDGFFISIDRVHTVALGINIM